MPMPLLRLDLIKMSAIFVLANIADILRFEFKKPERGIILISQA